jgi:formylmethanofuran dehydrogenase subunit B
VTSLTVTCPFCGLACDDIHVSRGEINTRGCVLAREGFARAAPEPRPHAVGGRAATFDQAISEAARILRNASTPLVYGLDADLNGVRALLALAERVGASVDHAGSGPTLANAAVARASGWVTATFAEVANRADFILLVASNPDLRFPRFRERLLENKTPLYRAGPPSVAYLGLADEATASIAAPLRAIVDRTHLLPALAALSLILLGREPDGARRELPLEALRGIAERLKRAQYGTIVWDLASFQPDVAELAVEYIAAMLRRLNAKTRCVGLPLGGSQNVLGAMQAAIWQAGWPLRLSFADGTLHHDPWRHDGLRMLAQDEADVLVWVATSYGRPPPVPAATVIAIISDHAVLPSPAAVEIRVGIPGIDHAGEIVRADTVIALPLQRARPSDRPSVARAAQAILAKLEAVP